jgi:hypothetical protein
MQCRDSGEARGEEGMGCSKQTEEVASSLDETVGLHGRPDKHGLA